MASPNPSKGGALEPYIEPPTDAKAINADIYFHLEHRTLTTLDCLMTPKISDTKNPPCATAKAEGGTLFEGRGAEKQAGI